MTPAARQSALLGLLGKPHRNNARGPDAYDCWHLAAEVSRRLFGRNLPDIAIPEHATWAWMVDAVATHPERRNWRECPNGPVVTASDGAIVLMARTARPAHIGIWLAPERRIIHADPRLGCVCEAPLELVTNGWRQLRYWEPIR